LSKVVLRRVLEGRKL